MRVQLLGLCVMVSSGCDLAASDEIPTGPLDKVTIDSDGGCALDADGELWCWGEASKMFPGQPAYSGEYNDCVDPFVSGMSAGIFGDCIATKPMKPRFASTDLAGVTITDLSIAGGAFLALLDANGHVWYFGPGVHSAETAFYEVVSGDIVFAQVDAGSTGWCGVTVDGDGYCYQKNNTNEPMLTPIPGGHHFVRISTGGFGFVALDDTGAAWQGVFARSATHPADFVPSEPQSIEPGAVFVDAQAAATYAGALGNVDLLDTNVCLLDAAGTVVCRGYNNYGRLGTGMLGGSDTRAEVNGVVASAIAVGDTHVCALSASGAVSCWGSNGTNELGGSVNTTCDQGGGFAIECSATPVEVVGIPPAVRIWTGNDITCAEANDGGLWCWGRNDKGQLGNATQRQAPTLVIRP